MDLGVRSLCDVGDWGGGPGQPPMSLPPAADVIRVCFLTPFIPPRYFIHETEHQEIARCLGQSFSRLGPSQCAPCPSIWIESQRYGFLATSAVHSRTGKPAAQPHPSPWRPTWALTRIRQRWAWCVHPIECASSGSRGLRCQGWSGLLQPNRTVRRNYKR